MINNKIEIIEVKTRKQINLFTEFPNRLYKNINNYVPPLSSDEKNLFNKKKNPCHDYCDSIRFLAYKNNKLVGRIAGIINFNWNQQVNEKILRFTRLDMIDDIEVTKALFDRLIKWGKQYNLNKVIGPIGFADTDRQGMLVEGFNEKGSFITIYNHPYYVKHLEELGFLKDVDWIEKRITIPSEVPEKLLKVSNLIKKRYGYYLVDLKSRAQLRKEIPSVFNIYNEAFMKLYGFYPLTDKVRDYYINQFIGIIKLDYVWIIKDKNDDVIGMGVVNPCLANASKKSKGKLFPFGWYRILKAIKHNTVVDFYFIAIKPEFQSKGVLALLLESGLKSLIKNGIKYAETGPELEENYQVQAIWKDYDYIEHKRRRCFKKEL